MSTTTLTSWHPFTA